MMSCWVRRRTSPVSVKEGFPAGDGDVAGQHLEGGGFSGAVDSQQPKTLAHTTGGISHTTGLFTGCFNTATLFIESLAFSASGTLYLAGRKHNSR